MEIDPKSKRVGIRSALAVAIFGTFFSGAAEFVIDEATKIRAAAVQGCATDIRRGPLEAYMSGRCIAVATNDTAAPSIADGSAAMSQHAERIRAEADGVSRDRLLIYVGSTAGSALLVGLAAGSFTEAVTRIERREDEQLLQQGVTT